MALSFQGNCESQLFPETHQVIHLAWLIAVMIVQAVASDRYYSEVV